MQSSGLTNYKKKSPTEVLSCEFCESFKVTYFEEHQQTATSVTVEDCTLQAVTFRVFACSFC